MSDVAMMWSRPTAPCPPLVLRGGCSPRHRSRSTPAWQRRPSATPADASFCGYKTTTVAALSSGAASGTEGTLFDFNVSPQDHFKLGMRLCRWVKQEREFSKSAQLGDSGPTLDLGFKDGQIITLNVGQGKKRDKPRPQGAGGFVLPPPPPGGRIAPPPLSGSPNHNIVPQTGDMVTDCLLELDSSNSNTVFQTNASSDLWGDSSAPASSVSPPSRTQNGSSFESPQSCWM